MVLLGMKKQRLYRRLSRSTPVLRDGLKEVTAEIQRLTHLSEGEMEMVDYYPLRFNHKQPEPNPKPGEEQEGQQPVVVDLVYNIYTERNGKTIALKVSFRLPLKS
jgi:hypothetical protein